MSSQREPGVSPFEQMRRAFLPERPTSVPVRREPGTVCIKMVMGKEIVVVAEIGEDSVLVHDAELYARLTTAPKRDE